MVMIISQESAIELERLLRLMDRAAADPKGSPITMDVLFDADFTKQGLGGAHDAVAAALDGEMPSLAQVTAAWGPAPAATSGFDDLTGELPYRDPRVDGGQRDVRLDGAPASDRGAQAPVAFDDLPEGEKQTALLEEVVDVLETVKLVLIAVAIVAMMATAVAAISLVT